jgi:hypothetical protein
MEWAQPPSADCAEAILDRGKKVARKISSFAGPFRTSGVCQALRTKKGRRAARGFLFF